MVTLGASATIDPPEEGSVLGGRVLNRALLARQLLLERLDAKPLEVVDHLVGMQAQVPLDPYVGLWSRVCRFDPDDLGQALLARRAVRMTLLRSTLHLVTSEDALQLRPLLQPVLERAFASSPFARSLAGLDLAPVLARGAELAEQEPLTTHELAAVLGERWPDRDANALAQAVRYLLPLVQVTPRGVWGMTKRPTLTTLAAWLEPRRARTQTTIDDLVLRYLRAFGPATTADIRTWSWISDVRSTIDRLRPRLRSYRDERGRVLYDVKDGLFVDSSLPVPARFLPQYDNVFLSHTDRSRIMDTVAWGPTFTHRGVLIFDGFIAGAWKRTEAKGDALLTVELRVRLSLRAQRQVRAEAESLLEFLAPAARGRRLVIETV